MHQELFFEHILEEISNPKLQKTHGKAMDHHGAFSKLRAPRCLPLRDLGEDVFALLVGLDVRRNLHWTALGAGQSRGAGIRKKIAWRGLGVAIEVSQVYPQIIQVMNHDLVKDPFGDIM